MSSPNPVAQPTPGPAEIYKLSEVEKVPTPDGAKGNWFRYIIEGGYAPVTGSRPGTQKQVVAYANELKLKNSTHDKRAVVAQVLRAAKRIS